jgi:hypothetical protein
MIFFLPPTHPVRFNIRDVLPSTFIRIEEELIEPCRGENKSRGVFTPIYKKNKALDKKEDASEGSDSEIGGSDEEKDN